MNSITFIYLYLIFCRCFLKSLTLASLDVTGVNPIYDLCPYTDYCTRNATKSLEDVSKSPCCTYCSCADNCWERGNCCVDKQNLIVKQPLESCVEVLLKHYYGLGLRPTKLPRYYVIQSCPTPYDPLVDKCSGNHQSSLEDFIWVTDEHTNKIYNNKYCAECHGVVNYTYWQLAMDCIDPVNGQMSREDAINHIIDSCSLSVLPPKSIDVHSNQCLVPKFSTCNVTGNWRTTYDQALETACHNFSQIYIRETRHSVVKFKNVYCFLCSVEPRDQIVQDTCMSWRLTDREAEGRTHTDGFMAFLDFTTIEREIDKLTDSVFGQGPVCASDEIQDPFQDGCLKLTCPMLHAPVNGKCKTLTSSTSLLRLSATLKLYPDRSKINLTSETSKYQIENVAAQLFKKLRQQLGLVERNCQPRDDDDEELCGNFDEKSIPEIFAIKIRYITSEDCQVSFIVDRLQMLLKNGINVQFDKEVVSFNAIAFSPLEFSQYCENVRDKYNFSIILKIFYFDFQRFSRCPFVLLNVGHYENLMKQASETSQRRDINSLFNLTALDYRVTLEKENFSVEVCFESYSSVLQKANHGMCYFCMKTTLVVMTLLSIILNIVMTL